jgi:carnitine O-acetyltransferase/carnitine O-palmitoyltransferase 2
LVVTPESVELIQAFTEGASDEVRYEALKHAVNARFSRVFEAKKGQGVAMHLYALYSLAHYKGSGVPAIFQDKTFEEFILDPSFCASTLSNKMGVEILCPTPCRDYGIGYAIDRNKIAFTVTSKHLQPEKLICVLQQCLLEIGKLL